GSPTPPEPDAFDATLARELAASLGVKAVLVGLAPNERDEALRDGRVDLLVAGVPTRDARDDAGRAQVVAQRLFVLHPAAAPRSASAKARAMPARWRCAMA
ncbi:hypothetical protein ACEN8K_45940, partial [Variovorax sp. CT11-76]